VIVICWLSLIKPVAIWPTFVATMQEADGPNTAINYFLPLFILFHSLGLMIYLSWTLWSKQNQV
jgi:hypothetical protein